ncbi:TonB-dependent receptor [Granulicella mallensis]|uniref:Cna B domain-containing protein n=1 Tax=Granulicella mallensis (strain ATCC BAA-1857 / DSM 23137 / MP5ACTX8) TaxID=682795 RepID=G8NUF2_GRAMM|nr:carboxypeptidase-like regulatory domain-containing protein [Granulicella mallensis]AEU35308.1 Cna B domain-containing protein [Granulicella mallensis MP5ACTX8]
MKHMKFSAECSQSVEAAAGTKIRKAFFLLILCFIALVSSAPLYGQAAGSFSGNVLDKSGSSVPGADVTVVSQAIGLTRVSKTDSAGHYLIPLLPFGTYTVRVDAAGFQSAVSKELQLQVQEARELDFSLSPATVNTTVVVTGDAVVVETGNSSLGQVITSQQVSQLPLNGRNFVQLATLTAGATAETNPNSFFVSGADSEVAARGPLSLSVGGSRPNSTDWILDGVDNNELTSGGIGIYSSIDDIQEFKVLTYTYSAEYGTRAGPTVLVTTKSGTNDIHGSLFEFVRNTDLDARNYFATTPTKFNLNQFGGSVGGPIRKDKTFLFVDGEQKYQREGITFTGLVPSLAMRSGDFSNDAYGRPATVNIAGVPQAVPGIVNPNMIGASTNPAIYPNVYFQCNASGAPLPVNPDGSQAQGIPCGKIPTGLINNIGQAMINLYPTPNANNPGQNYNYVNAPVRSLNETKFDTRLDQTFSSKDTAFARFSYDQATSYVPGGAPGFAEASAFGSNQRIANHARNVALSETHVFSPKMLNQASFGYNRIFDYILSQGTGTCASNTIVPGGIPGANLGCGSGSTCAAGAYSCGLTSTEMTNGGYWALGDRGYSPFQGGTNIYSFKDSFDLILHKHDLRMGLDFRANQMNVGSEAFGDGFWLIGNGGNFTATTAPSSLCTSSSTANCAIPGNSEADFLLGLSGGGIHDQTYDGAVTGRRWKIYRPFIADDWRVTPSLTLNLSLAWDMTTPITEEHGRMADYIPSTGQLLVANQNGVGASAGINMDWTALEPRIGAAWKVLGSEKTVLRAGYSLYHDSAWSQGAQGLWQNPPFLGESDRFTGAGCAFATSYCASPAGGSQTPTGYSLSDGFQLLPTPPTVSNYQGSFTYEPTNLKLGRVQQFNVNVERQLFGNLVLTAGYAGSRGTHILMLGNDLNTSSPSGCGTVTGYTLGCLPSGAPYIPPYNVPNFNAILLIGDVGKANYDSLQIKAETKTPKYGIYALVAYTYSRTYDNGLSDGLGSELSAPYFPLPNWQNLDWSLSQINLDNSLTASVIYDLPFGRGKQFGSNWNSVTNTFLGGIQVTLIERISSGFPVPLIDTSNNSGAFFENGGNSNNWNRPDQVAGCDPYKADHSKHQWLNQACFTSPVAGELGNAARVPVVGPDFVNTDFSLIKQFALPRKNMGLNFRAEFYNLFNHPQYGMPVNDISAGSALAAGASIPNTSPFGAVNSTVNNPRLVQLALKLSF